MSSEILLAAFSFACLLDFLKNLCYNFLIEKGSAKVEMKIIGVDASSKSFGYSIFEDKQLVSYGCLTASSTDLIKRINKILKEFEDVLSSNKDTKKIIMEEVIPIVGKNNKTYKALMWLQGAVAIMVHDKFPNIKIEYIYPSSWRSNCSIKTGKSITREQLKKADIDFVKKKYGIDVNDDIADAIGIAHSSIYDFDINFE